MQKATKSESATRTNGTPRSRRAIPPASFTRDAVAQRAYQLFLESGARHGRDLDHWLRAEQELLSESAARKVAS